MPATVRVQYVGPHDEFELPTLGVSVKRGDEITVSATVGASLLDQPSNWQPVREG